MEVKNGFKNTEVGVIPVNWKSIIIGNISIKVGSGITPTGGEKVYKKEGHPFIRSQNVGWGEMLLSNVAFIDDEIHNSFNSSEIQENDILLNITGASIGRSAVAGKNLIGGNVNQHVCIIRVEKTKIIPSFLKEIILSNLGQGQINSFQAGGNRQGLNFNQIKSIKIPLPPLSEQQAITGVLSDTDNLIQSLEKQIAKKRLIKQGVMQKLFTPKKGWEEKRLGDIFEIVGGFSATREQLSDDGYCYLHYGDIHGSNRTFIDCDSDYSKIPKLRININKISKKSLLKNGDVVFVDASEDEEGTSRHVVIRNSKNIPFISGLHTIVARSKDESLDIKYKGYCFHCKYVKDQFKFYSVGTKVSGVSKTSIKNIIVYIPQLDEQISIANNIESIDYKIETLEKKLTKYKLLKQGLMQNLLTGKIRLK